MTLFPAVQRPGIGLVVFFAGMLIASCASADLFRLPTANKAIFEKGGENRFYAPTPGKTSESGMFGCVRTDGWQMHEGLDILFTQHDRKGEPTDPVLATADGTVMYVNAQAGLSTYGRYIIIRHVMEGLEIYSLYAHLSQTSVKNGEVVKAGQQIGILGRSTSSKTRIGKDRAHLHFELDFLVNDRFVDWFKKNRPGERNDHGAWNGNNMAGIDPRKVLLEQQAKGASFSLRQMVMGETELCRVLVKATSFSWLRRSAGLIVPNPSLGNQPPAGYELVLNYNGVPIQAIPRPASDFHGTQKFRLLSVNAAEYERNHCRKLVAKHGTTWNLTTHGQSYLELLTY